MPGLSVEEILGAVAELSLEERERFEAEYEKNVWEQCLNDSSIVAMLGNRYSQAREAFECGNVKTLKELRAEFEAQGLL